MIVRRMGFSIHLSLPIEIPVLNFSMKHLTLIPIGGLGNRIFAIASAIAYCAAQQCRLRIVWFRDWGMGAQFRELFELEGKVRDVEVVDARWRDYIYDRPRRRNLWIPYPYQRFAFDKRLYEQKIYREGSGIILPSLQNARNAYLVFWAELPTVSYDLDCLRLTAPLAKQVFDRTNAFPTNTIGIHIRRTDNIRSIQNSPLSLFIEKMRGELKVHPDTKFYVASDSLHEKQELVHHFPDKIITVWKETDRSSRQGIEDALVELYSLAATRKIFGSVGSSYSILAGRIGGIPVEIVSK